LRATLHRSGPRRSAGISLTVALIFLFAMSALGIAAMNGAGNEERMARNDRDHAIALAAAEAALRDAELDIRQSLGSTPYTWLGAKRLVSANAPGTTNFSCSCGSDLGATQHGLCLPISHPSCSSLTANPWEVASNWRGSSSVTLHGYTGGGLATDLPGVGTVALGTAQSPRYLIEIIPDTDSPVCSAKAGVSCNFYRYRITARGWGPNAGYAMVQETFQP